EMKMKDRKHSINLRTGLIAVCLSALLVACAGDPNRKQKMGTLLGAAIGGLAGAQVGDGRGNKAAIALGAILGAMAGSAIGRQLDEADLQKMAQTTRTSIRQDPVGTSRSWQSSQNDNISGTVTPIRDYKNTDGTVCRDYRQTVTMDGQTQEQTGTACRQTDGSWALTSS
ncbi:MAG: RT0821/Lpp0805 family surface protein, partial [Alphaproteobacteria bacterium]|nr:RT0821/Lpp0805 family surface protein [Alphaproteobacteria bacterium]